MKLFETIFFVVFVALAVTAVSAQDGVGSAIADTASSAAESVSDFFSWIYDGILSVFEWLGSLLSPIVPGGN